MDEATIRLSRGMPSRSSKGLLGSIQSILKMLPFAGMQQAVNESPFARIEAIINSMTSKKRPNSAIIDGSRRKRVAARLLPCRRSTTSPASTLN
jgi:hypothetical protein